MIPPRPRRDKGTPPFGHRNASPLATATKPATEGQMADWLVARDVRPAGRNTGVRVLKSWRVRKQ